MAILESFLNTLADLANKSGFAGFLADGGWKNVIMILISFVFMYLAIAKGFEPLLLLPISFGMLLTNLPGAGMYHSEFWQYMEISPEMNGWKFSTGVNGMWQQSINKGTEFLIPAYHLFDYG